MMFQDEASFLAQRAAPLMVVFSQENKGHSSLDMKTSVLILEFLALLVQCPSCVYYEKNAIY